MLSTQYRLQLEFICKKIANKKSPVRRYDLGRETCQETYDCQRLVKESTSPGTHDIEEGTMDDFMNKMDRDPDPSNHKTGRWCRRYQRLV